jgi:magnesium-protoporphyrin O-methyltransferase
VLDAGCGTGALAIEAARRGARVVAIDLSGELIKHARLHLPRDVSPSAIDFRVGDMTDRTLGRFDHVVAMDSLIHYAPADMARLLALLAGRAERSVLFTFAPRTAMLTAMHMVGRLFPRGDRSPSIVPVRAERLLRLLAAEPGLELWRAGRTHRVDRGFYKSQAMELVAP